MRHIKLLQTLHVPDLRRQRALKIIETDVKHRQVLQKPDLRRQTAGEIVVQQNDLVESLRHLSDTPGNTTSEVVVSKHQNRNRGVSKILGDSEPEPVVVQENGVEVFVEELQRNRAFELVEPEVEVFQRRERQYDLRELSDEAVVADVELVEELHLAETRRNDAAEPVGVEVEQSEVGEETELRREVSGDVSMVEVDSGDDSDLGVGRREGAVDAGVGADVGAVPVGGEV